MTNLTLRQFRYFEALARLGHFGRAAEACAVSQPALSMQIKEMERTLGAALFERSARAVRLTSFGEAFALRARAILSAVDEVGDLARAAQNLLAGRLRIGVIPTVAPYLLPAIIGALLRENAAIDIHVRETVTQKLIAELAERRLDTAIVALPVSEPSLTEVALFSEEFVLVRPRADAGRRSPTARRCATCACCCWRRGIAFAIRRCRSARRKPRRRANCSTPARSRRWCRWSARASASP